MSNYVIAIGGTGIRVLRHVVHLCDCGHIDADELKVLIIDPDITNGSRDAVRTLIDEYSACREDIRGADTKNFAPFKTKISQAVKESLALTPVTGPDGSQQTKKYHIKDMVSRGDQGCDAEINFMKALFSHKEYAELNMSEGFFAHPSIGSLAFARWLEESVHIKGMLDDMLNELGSTGEKINIFIIASSFGGTGASGFPAVARKIRDALNGYPGRLHIAGMFLLPYFSFMRKEGDSEQLLDPKKFLASAKNAMVYYREHKATDVFDKVYVLGAPDTEDDNKSLRIIRNKYADMGEDQDNWPHVVELYAALAAKECFSSTVTEMLSKKDKLPSRNWVSIGVDKAAFFDMTWEDMPGGEALRKSLSKFLLFNYVFIPAVLNEFTQHSDGGLKKKKMGSDVQWPAIVREPFVKKRAWDDTVFGDSDGGLLKFKRLLDYFNGQATWLYRMVTEYEYDDSVAGQERFKRFFVHTMLRSRYVIAQQLKSKKNINLAKITEAFIKDCENNIGADKAFVTGSKISWSAVYADIYNRVHRDIKTKTDVDIAIRQILQSVYSRIAKHVT